MKTCATCEYLDDNLLCYKCNTVIGVRIVEKYRQSCTEHKEKVEKKKVLMRWALMASMFSSEGYFITNDTSVDNNDRFIRWLTPEDMKKIMNGEEIEVEP